MKNKLVLSVLALLALNACTNTQQKHTAVTIDQDSIAMSNTDSIKNSDSKEITNTLALSANAIQLVNKTTGSTKEMPFGMPFEQATVTVGKILNAKPTVNINSECGAGPLKMATWQNGLTLMFQQKENEWLFVGWAANQSKKPELKLTTMAGIGVGSTKKEMESAYVIIVDKTSLGYEFSTKSDDLFGIFDGGTGDAKITNMWSGVSCNFR